jgi:hypothetical protein
MIDKALVIAFFAATHPAALKTIDKTLPDVISRVADTEEEMALLAYYAWRESNGLANPGPTSWDAKAGISCGVFQLPCSTVASFTIEQQARLWISIERKPGGLVSLDSDRKRAEKRKRIALANLEKAKATISH